MNQNEMYDTILKIFNKLSISLLITRKSSITATMLQRNLCQQQNFSNIVTDHSSITADLSNLVINHENFNSHLIHYFCCICIITCYLILYHHQETHFSLLWYIQKWKFHLLNYLVSSHQLTKFIWYNKKSCFYFA